MELSHDWSACRSCAAAHLPESTVPTRIPIARRLWRTGPSEAATWQHRIFRRKRRRQRPPQQQQSVDGRPEHQPSAAWRCGQLDASAGDRLAGTPTCPGPPVGTAASARADAVVYVPQRLGRWLKRRGRRWLGHGVRVVVCASRTAQQKQRKQQSLWIATSAEPG